MVDIPSFAPPQPRLPERLRDKIRSKLYSIGTESAYADSISRFMQFHVNG